MQTIDFRLYLITDRKTAKVPLEEAVEEAFRAGLKAVQLREKDMTGREVLALATKLRELSARYGAKLFINDRVDVALLVGADGVHLGQSSMPIPVVRGLVGENVLIGQSTHSLDEATEAARKGADFITLGPVYETPSKLMYGAPVGIETLQKVRKKVKVPVFAIGGIKVDNVGDVMGSGADGIAVISGILSGDSVFDATKKYLESL
ncbi:MAG: thiamine phosphate synthase [Nitrospirae bacterium]|uniref:thiamine phosphate synthase n=1 Tax=Candidatus Magnetobacterium casense TaxID=1455061 RepID=UPI00058B4C37|nr:thiamine phosphate synthase [Candidatus Magnetobacterium casensis]MBF0338222.1 thiamine phosphate synthase [Nitrospirota bacterium]